MRLHQYPEALRWLRRGLTALEGAEEVEATVERAKLMASYASVRQLQSQPADAIEWAQKAIAEAQRARTGPQEAEGLALHILDWAYLVLGQAVEARYAEHALEIFEGTGNLKRLGSVLNHLAMRAYLEGRWDDSLGLAHRAREASEAIGDSWMAAVVRYNIAEVLADQGRFAEAEPVVREAVKSWSDTGASSDAAEAKSLLARVLTNTGQLEEAQVLLDESMAYFREAGDEAEVLRADARMGDWLLASGEADAALRLVTAAIARAEQADGVASLASELHRLRGRALAALGDTHEARAAFEYAVAVARSTETNLLGRSTDFEVGQAYAALASLAEETGEDAAGYAAARDEILRPLGVIC